MLFQDGTISITPKNTPTAGYALKATSIEGLQEEIKIIDQVLDSLSIAPGDVTSSDTVATSIGKTVGNISAINNINGLRLSWASATTLGLTSGYWNVLNSSVMRTSAALTINIANTGVVNGLDTGVAANSTNYYVYAIAHGTTPALNGAILSTNATTPTLPSGYTVFRYIGRVRRDGSGNFISFTQTGNGTNRTTTYTDTQSSTYFLVGGSSTTFAATSMALFVPPGSTSGFIRYDYDSNPSSSGALSLRPTGSSIAAGATILRVQPGFAGFTAGLIPFVCNTSQSIDYVFSPAGVCNICVYSYNENL